MPKTELEEFKEMLEGWQPKCISLQPKEVLMRLKQAEQRVIDKFENYLADDYNWGGYDPIDRNSETRTIKNLWDEFKEKLKNEKDRTG